MSKYLTIPAADGDSLANAQLHTSNALTGLTTGTSYICYQLSQTPQTLTYTGEEVTMSVAARAEGDVSITVAADNTSYILSLNAGANTIEINGLLYAFDTADVIGQAPLILTDPLNSATSIDDLSMLTQVDYTPAPYVYDPQGGVAVMTLTTLRDGVTLGTGTSYAPTDFDKIAGFDLQQDVVNGYGLTATATQIVPPLPYSGIMLPFTGNEALAKSDGIQANGADTVLIAVNATLQDRTGTIFRDPSGANLRAFFNASVGRLYAADMNARQICNYDSWYPTTEPLSESDSIGLLIYLKSSGYVQFVTFRNGTAITSLSRTKTGTDSPINTTQTLTVGMTDFGGSKDYSIKGGLWDFRIWTDVPTTLDVSAANFVSMFMDGTGTAKHPSIANTFLGMPRIWLPTDATQANALVNLGTAGNFTQKLGTFA